MAQAAMIQFQNQVTGLNDDVKQLRDVTKTLRKLVSYKFSSVVSDEEAERIACKITEIEGIFQQQSGNIRQKLDVLRTEAEQTKGRPTSSDNPVPYETRMAHWKGLVCSYRDACGEFRNAQIEHQRLEEDFVVLAVKNKHPELRDDEIKEKLRKGDDSLLQEPSTFGNPKNEYAKDRNAKVKEIATNINDLCTLIDELHRMIEDSGNIIDRIEVRMQSSVAQTSQANQNLRSALRYQLTATRLKRVIYMSLLIVFIVVISYLGWRAYQSRPRRTEDV